MNTRSGRSITIVGGGLAGLTLGIGLRRRDVPVAICEAGHYPRHRVCGEFISGRGQAVLERLGLGRLLSEAGAIQAHNVRFFSGNRSGPARTLRAPALSLSRFVFDSTLAYAFTEAGGELREGVRWQSDFGEGVVQATGRRVAPNDGEQRWFGLKVHARNMTLTADLEMHSLGNGYVGLSRLSGDEVNVCGLFRRLGTDSSANAAAQPGPSARISGTAGRTLAWKTRLCGPEGSALHTRLLQAEFDADSFCSVAGLCLEPHLEAGQTDCRIGDALTMTPPVTGNGMSMAFETAAIAVEPLTAYSRGSMSWSQVRTAIALACEQTFASRLAWARRLQWLMFAPILRPFAAPLLNSTLLWRTLLAKTR